MSERKCHVKLTDRLETLGIDIPLPPAAIGSFVAGTIHNDILYVSGTYGTVKDSAGVDHILTPGKLGAALTIEQGYARRG